MYVALPLHTRHLLHNIFHIIDLFICSLAPASEEEWNEIENGVNSRAIYVMENCREETPRCGSEFWNYKGSNSFVLLAIVDHDYCFCTSALERREKLSWRYFQGKTGKRFLSSGEFIVGDDEFSLITYLLKAYSHKPLISKQKIFNYRLSRTCKILENPFGILTNRFRIFQELIMTSYYLCIP